MTVESVESGSEPRVEPGCYRILELVAYFLFAVGPLVGNAVLVLLGAIAADFALDPTAVLVAIPAFMFPFAFFQLFSGAVSDVYGRIPVIVGGLVIFAVGLFLTASATSLAGFALGNLVAGVGFGFVNPVLLALLSDCAPPHAIPQRMGIASALASLSVGLGPFIAGQMVVFGWQTYYLLFMGLVICGLFAIAIARRPPTRPQEDAGVRVLVTNLRLELRKPVVVLLLATTFLVSLTYLGALVWTSRGLTGVMEETRLGLLLLGGGISGTVAGMLLGTMIEKRGVPLPLSLGFLALFSGLALFILVGDITKASATVIVGLALITVGWAGGLLFPIMIIFSQILSPQRRGVLAGVVTFSFFLGSALIPTIYAPLFRRGITMVYLGVLGVSLILLLFFVVLVRKVELETPP